MCASRCSSSRTSSTLEDGVFAPRLPATRARFSPAVRRPPRLRVAPPSLLPRAHTLVHVRRSLPFRTPIVVAVFCFQPPTNFVVVLRVAAGVDAQPPRCCAPPRRRDGRAREARTSRPTAATLSLRFSSSRRSFDAERSRMIWWSVAGGRARRGGVDRSVSGARARARDSTPRVGRWRVRAYMHRGVGRASVARAHLLLDFVAVARDSLARVCRLRASPRRGARSPGTTGTYEQDETEDVSPGLLRLALESAAVGGGTNIATSALA